MDEKILKEKLKKIKSNDYEIFEDINIWNITNSMLYNIGNTDSELRDDLIYSTFYQWIIEKNYYNKRELKKILNTALDEDHLFYKIGNTGDDSVLVRSFSALVIALLIASDRNDQFLNKNNFDYSKNKFFDYYKNEKDHRGYILSKGWAHSAAHGADVLDEFAQSSFTNNNDLVTILDLLRNKVFTDSYVFINEEDERMVTAAVSVLKRINISSNDVTNWLTSFKDFEIPEEYFVYHRLITNIKGFLRSLYFRIEDKSEFSEITDILREIIQDINKYKKD